MSATQKAVLISLADNANDEGVCWPSVPRIALRTCLSDRAVQSAIKWLCEANLLAVKARNGRSTLYTLTPEAYSPPNVVPPQADTPAPEPGSPPPPTTFNQNHK
ncbi:helix-turn-helix domain-containing protein [Pseudomonas fulva]|uniref:helix-turn-helix domain-containing protein n=1 Tax=Pseudomonas fulva TaxID=47880 RepID=UPI001F40B4C0|nr:helix-turn-helix domain-containing protein [Pseudomonas fulva]